MAPVADLMGLLSKRQSTTYCDVYGCYSNWDNWGRWVALVVIILSIGLIAFVLSRRRRHRGSAPMYGTGWIPYTGHPNQNKPPGYGDPNYHPPPPYMGNQATGTTFNPNDGYYGAHGTQGQQAGGSYELQQPSSSYQPQRGGDPVYDAPAGPPPGKGGFTRNDGVIR